MVKLQRTLAGILGSALLFGPHSTAPLTSSFTEVYIGKKAYAEEPLVSHDFAACSAVILDEGTKGLMAHAIPGAPFNLAAPFTSVDSYLTGSDTVVPELVAEATHKHFDLSKTKAYVVFGPGSPREHILSDLRNAGITIEHVVNSSLSHSRSVYFDPRTDSLIVGSSNSQNMKELRKYRPMTWEGP